MVSTRRCSMDTRKNNKNATNGVNDSGTEKSKMKPDNKFANCSNPESEEDEHNTQANTSAPPGSSIKVTLKKTRSCSTSSRESTQSFKVVRNVLPLSESASDVDDDENQKSSDNEKTSDKQADDVAENEKESEDESQNDNSSDDGIEILSSDDDSLPSKTHSPAPANPVAVKEENKLSLNTVIDLKTEEVSNQNLTIIKNENSSNNLLKEEVPKDSNSDFDVIIVKDDENDSAQASRPLSSEQPQNGVEKKETKELKFKLNVRNDLVAPHPSNLINMPPPSQIDGQPNFLSQNGAPFSPSTFINLLCDVCGVQFDSSELLNEHKKALKHYKCTFKECEHLILSNQEEFLDHQRLIHNIMPSPVQQLAHQVQRLPAMGFDQQLQSGVPPLPENLPPPGVPNLYTQTLRMPSQPVPMQRTLRPMMRPNAQQMISSRGRGGAPRARGRSMSMNPNMIRGTMKRPASMPMRQPPPTKRVAIDRNSYSNNMNKTPQIIKSLSESLTKSLTSANKPQATPSQQDVVNLFSKRGLTISTVDTVNNISIPAGLSLNSAVSIIPTSPHKTPNNTPNKMSCNISKKNLDTVDLTGPDKPRGPIKFFPCDICSKTYQSVESLYEHVATSHKTVVLQYKCNLCAASFPNADILKRHKATIHKAEFNANVPFVIPILDLTKPSTVSKLQSMGVTNYVPVGQLDNQGGQFGVPIMSVSRPGSLEGLKYSNFFNLGCIRKI